MNTNVAAFCFFGTFTGHCKIAFLAYCAVRRCCCRRRCSIGGWDFFVGIVNEVFFVRHLAGIGGEVGCGRGGAVVGCS